MKEPSAYLHASQDEAIHHKGNEECHLHFCQYIIEVESRYHAETMLVSLVGAYRYEIGECLLQHAERSVCPRYAQDKKTTNDDTKEEVN